MRQLIEQRDVGLPQSHLMTSADYAELVRLGEELTEEIRHINLRQGELLRMRSLSDSGSNRRAIEFDLKGVRRD